MLQTLALPNSINQIFTRCVVATSRQLAMAREIADSPASMWTIVSSLTPFRPIALRVELQLIQC